VLYVWFGSKDVVVHCMLCILSATEFDEVVRCMLICNVTNLA